MAAVLVGAVGVASAAETLTFDTSKYSQKPTGCDQLAAHPDDPLKVAPGVRQSQMDLPAAIAACEAAVAREPQNPRLRYQLARAYGYSGQGERSAPHRDAAVTAEYPQSLFVVGYLYLNGENKAPKDPCRAAQLIYRSAQYGRLAGLIGYPMWVVEGRFADCPTPQERTELAAFLDRADEQTSDFYQESLIGLVRRDLQAFRPKRR